MDLGLTDRVAIVTGGSEGIGKAAARSLAAEGARVAVCARRLEVLERAAAEIRSATGGSVLAVQCDVREEAAVQRLVQRVVDEWGRLDILVNNAGTSAAAPFEAVTDEMWTGDLQLKVYGAIYCIRASLPHMRAAGWGRIVNITTPAGKAAPGGSLAHVAVAGRGHCADEGAVEGLRGARHPGEHGVHGAAQERAA